MTYFPREFVRVIKLSSKTLLQAPPSEQTKWLMNEKVWHAATFFYTNKIESTEKTNAGINLKNYTIKQFTKILYFVYMRKGEKM